MNIDYDFHIHTIYSGHAASDMFVGNIIQNAADKELSHIAIVEHVPDISTFPSPEEGWYQLKNQRHQLDAIIEEICLHRDDYPNLDVLTGAEIDADPFKRDGRLMLENLEGLDIVLAATHAFPGGEAFWFDTAKLSDEDKNTFFNEWLAWSAQTACNPAVQVFAHPGAFLAANHIIPSFRDEFLKKFEPLLETFRRENVAFELNELTTHKIEHVYAESYKDLVRLAKEKGVKFSIGSDAHSIAPIGVFNWVLELIEYAGITEQDLFMPKKLA